MEKATLYLPRELMATYSALSRKLRRAKSELMRGALRGYVVQQEYRLPGGVGRIDTDDEVNAANVKDWLRENWKPR